MKIIFILIMFVGLGNVFSNETEDWLKKYFEFNKFKFPHQVNDLNIDQDSFLVQYYLKVSTFHGYYKTNDSALYYLDKAEKLAKDLKSDSLIGRTLTTYGINYFLNENLIKALEYFYEAENYADGANDLFYLGLIYTNIALIWINLEDFEKYLEYFNKSIELNRKTGKIESNIMLWFEKAEHHIKKENYAEARKAALNTFLEEPTKLKDYWNSYRIVNYTSILINTKYYNEAKIYLDSLEKIISSQKIYFKDDIYNNLVELNIKQGNFENALNFLEKFKNTPQKQYKYTQQKLFLLEAEVMYGLKKYNKSLEKLNNINKDSISVKVAEFKIEMFDLYAKIFKAMDSLDLYSYYSEKIINLRDSLTYINNIERQKIQQLKLELKRNEIIYEKKLESNIENLKDQKITIVILIVLSVFGLLLLALILFKINKKRRVAELNQRLTQNEKDKAEVEKQIAETENQALIEELKTKEKSLIKKSKDLKKQIEKNDNLNSQLNEKLFESSKNSSLYDIINQIKNNESKEVYWKKFELKFLEVYPEFFNILKQNYPDLTKTELKVLAFIKMKFSSKEIAGVFGIEPTSIDRHRTHIRKKLKIEKSKEIFDVISKLP